MGNPRRCLSYRDVRLVSKLSSIASRDSIDTRSRFSRRIFLNIPLVSANMDTVTEADMAIAMAGEGGLGVIHRFLTIDEQAKEVEKVKRAESSIIENPITISPDDSLKNAIELMKRMSISGLIVVQGDGCVCGILTSRDVRFKDDLKLKVSEVMTPKEKLVVAKLGITDADALALLDKHKIEKLPLIGESGRLEGLIAASDFLKRRKRPHAAKDEEGRLLVGAAVGFKDGLERAKALVGAGCDVLVIDVAHGNHVKTIQLVRELKAKFPEVDVVAGNVDTAEGVRNLAKSGADAVKIGIGPGDGCLTRIIAGAGVPQFTAVCDCSVAAKNFGIPVIADGGVRVPADVSTAIGAGASTVMIGSYLAGSEETPGPVYNEGGEFYKIYRGMASREASIDRECVERDAARVERAPEGRPKRVPYRGRVKLIIKELMDGLRSGMSYTGAPNIKEFWDKAEFVEVPLSEQQELRAKTPGQ